MLEWKRERNGSTALLLKGARRVGKSTVAKDFKKDGQTLLVPIYMTPLL